MVVLSLLNTLREYFVQPVFRQMVSANKTDWDRKLLSVVHAYNTLEKKTTGMSLYFLVFGQTALHSIEMEVETLKVMAARIGNWIQNSKYWMIAIRT